MSNKKMQDMLTDPDKKVNETVNVLARLIRQIFYDLGIDYPRLNRDINRFLNEQQQEVHRSTKEQTRERGNLVKEICGDELTWKNFVKAIKVLNPISMEIQVTLKWRRTQTIHTVNVNVAGINSSDVNDKNEE